MYKVKTINGHINKSSTYEEYEELLNSVENKGLEIVSIQAVNYSGMYDMPMVRIIVTYKED